MIEFQFYLVGVKLRRVHPINRMFNQVANNIVRDKKYTGKLKIKNSNNLGSAKNIMGFNKLTPDPWRSTCLSAP